MWNLPTINSKRKKAESIASRINILFDFESPMVAVSERDRARWCYERMRGCENGGEGRAGGLHCDVEGDTRYVDVSRVVLGTRRCRGRG
jgi:hypothetical protein